MGYTMACSFLPGMSTYSRMGSSMDCSVDIYSGDVLHCLQESNLRHHGHHNEPQGNLCSSNCFTDRGVCRAISLTFSHSSLRAVAELFLSFLKCVVAEVPPVLLMDWSFGLHQVRLGASWDYCLSVSWGQVLVSSHRRTPAVPQLPKPCQINQ